MLWRVVVVGQLEKWHATWFKWAQWLLWIGWNDKSLISSSKRRFHTLAKSVVAIDEYVPIFGCRLQCHNIARAMPKQTTMNMPYLLSSDAGNTDQTPHTFSNLLYFRGRHIATKLSNLRCLPILCSFNADPRLFCSLQEVKRSIMRKGRQWIEALILVVLAVAKSVLSLSSEGPYFATITKLVAAMAR